MDECQCQEALQLRDAYLMALSIEDSVRSASCYKGVTAHELSAAHEQLRVARHRYWAHVVWHHCRRTSEAHAAG
jgi:hypothetical protein